MTDPMPSDATRLETPATVSVERSLQQFETRLTERTKIPPNKLGEYMSWPEDRLKRESSTVSRVLRRFAEAVVDSMENTGAADRFLQDLDLKSISRDHDWRAIFSTIRAQEAGYEGYKRAVLIKYLQYPELQKAPRGVRVCQPPRPGRDARVLRYHAVRAAFQLAGPERGQPSPAEGPELHPDCRSASRWTWSYRTAWM